MVFFLASLTDEDYECVLEIFEAYESCELKDQTLSKAQRCVSKFSKIDCKGVHFKPLRAIAPVTRSELDLLMKVRVKKFSFKELEEEAQTNFVSYLNMESWEEAIKKNPSFTSKEKLEPFFGLTFRPGKMPPSFVKLIFNHEQNVLKFTSAAVIALFCQALTF